MSGTSSRWEEPPGVRACKKGGKWYPAINPNTGRAFLNEDADLVARRCSAVEAAALRAELMFMMDRARTGALAYGRGGDVQALAATSSVLEIRLPDRQFKDGRRHMRLLYGEPRGMPGVLVALRLFWKWPSDGNEREAQTEAAKGADKILHEYLNPMRETPT